MGVLNRLNENVTSRVSANSTKSKKESFIESSIRKFDTLSSSERDSLKTTRGLLEGKNPGDKERGAKTMAMIEQSKRILENTKQVLGENTLVSNLGQLANNYLAIVDYKNARVA